MQLNSSLLFCPELGIESPQPPSLYSHITKCVVKCDRFVMFIINRWETLRGWLTYVWRTLQEASWKFIHAFS
jgi:hypothetical protein